MKVKKGVLTVILMLLLCLMFCACTKGMAQISFYVDGELYDTYWVKLGESFDQTVEVPEKDGMLGEWNVTDFDEVKTDIRVDAVYSSAYCYVTFKADNVQIAQIKVKKNDNIPNAKLPAVPEKEGYIGVWNQTVFRNVTVDTTVNAVYSPKTCAVNFFVGEEKVASKYILYGKTLTDIPSIPTIQGHNYSSKWQIKTVVGENEPQYSNPDFSKIKSDLNLYAYYYITLTLVDSYRTAATVFEYDINCVIDKAYEVGSNGSLDFFGWYSDEDYYDAVAFPLTVTENTQLYARWLSTVGDTGFTYDNGLVTGYSGELTDITVPYKYTVGEVEYPVIGVAQDAFKNNVNVESVSLPGTAVKIGDGAFYGCVSLNTVIFRDGGDVRSIGNAAFYGCSALTEINLSKFTSAIGEAAFYNCVNLRRINNLGVTILTEIKKDTFYNVGKSVTLSGEAQIIETTLRLPSTLAKIGESAFGNVKYRFAFADMDSVTGVEDYAFDNCVGLYVFNPSALKETGVSVFRGCYNLKNASFVSDKRVFASFRKVGDGTVGGDEVKNSYIVNYDGSGYYVPKSLNIVKLVANQKINDSDPASGTVIDNCMIDCSSVKTVIFSGRIIEIKEYAFALSDEDKALSGDFSVTFPDTLKTLGAYAFSKRADLKSVAFNRSLESIGEYCFYNLSSLANVSVVDNNSLTSLGKYVFNGTEWLRKYNGLAKVGRICVGFGTEYLINASHTQINAELLGDATVIAPYAFENNGKIIEVYIPSTVTAIGEYAFLGCVGLVDFGIAQSDVTVAEGILSGCYSVNKLMISLNIDIESLFGTEAFANSYTVKEGEKTYYLPVGWNTLSILCDGTHIIKSGVYCGYASLTTINLGEGITTIYDGSFTDNNNLTTVNLPSSLEIIGKPVDDTTANEGVFLRSYALNKVVFADNCSLINIGDKAFFRTSITDIIIPSKTETIGEYAFAETALRGLTFVGGDKPLTIGSSAFKDVVTFSSDFTLTAPKNLTSIGKESFSGCNLTKIKLNDGLITLSEGAFLACPVKNLTLPSSVVFYDEQGACLSKGVFKNNNVMETITLFNGIRMSDLFDGAVSPYLVEATVTDGIILDGQFKNISTLQKITLENVDSIGSYAFYGNNFVTALVPSTVTAVGDYAFAANSKLTNFMFANGSRLNSVGEYAFAGDGKLLEVIFPTTVANTEWTGVFSDCSSLNKTNVPQDVTVIGNDAYKNNSSLSVMDIPRDIISIGDDAFYNCSLMDFESGGYSLLTTVGKQAFYGCAKLRGFRADNVKTIGKDAFANCSALSEATIINDKVASYVSNLSQIQVINISSAMTTFATDAFDGCDNLDILLVCVDSGALVKSVLIEVNAIIGSEMKVFVKESVYASFDGDVKAMDVYARTFPYPTAFSDGDFELNSQTMTAKVTGYSGTNSVIYIPSVVTVNGAEYTVTEIGALAFANRTDIVDIVIPLEVTALGDWAFLGCANLKTAVFETGSRLIDVGASAFSGCSSLRTIALPDSVTSIGDNAFYGAEALTEVVIGRNSGLTNVGEYAFYGTKKLNEVIFTSELASLGKFAFAASGVVKVAFGPKSLITNIEEKTFYNCQKLTTLILPDSVVTVANDAFEGCPNYIK